MVIVIAITTPMRQRRKPGGAGKSAASTRRLASQGVSRAVAMNRGAYSNTLACCQGLCASQPLQTYSTKPTPTAPDTSSNKASRKYHQAKRPRGSKWPGTRRACQGAVEAGFERGMGKKKRGRVLKECTSGV